MANQIFGLETRNPRIKKLNKIPKMRSTTQATARKLRIADWNPKKCCDWLQSFSHSTPASQYGIPNIFMQEYESVLIKPISENIPQNVFLQQQPHRPQFPPGWQIRISNIVEGNPKKAFIKEPAATLPQFLHSSRSILAPSFSYSPQYHQTAFPAKIKVSTSCPSNYRRHGEIEVPIKIPKYLGFQVAQDSQNQRNYYFNEQYLKSRDAEREKLLKAQQEESKKAKCIGNFSAIRINIQLHILALFLEIAITAHASIAIQLKLMPQILLKYKDLFQATNFLLIPSLSSQDSKNSYSEASQDRHYVCNKRSSLWQKLYESDPYEPK